ncbi:MAG: hypothetical protein V1922_03760 [bacterium]
MEIYADSAISLARHKAHPTRPVKLLAMAAFMLAAGCTGRAPSSGAIHVPPPLPVASADISPVLPTLVQGTSLRTEADIHMLNTTIPGIDLTYSGNERVTKIRSIPDPTERILKAIGFLDVENSVRYSTDVQGVYVCNVYALDLLRLVLGNHDIGSSYSQKTGMPSVRGPNDPALSNDYLFLHANNLDKWMQTYGVKYGWRKANTQEELRRILATNAIGLGVSSQDYITKQERGFTGHSFVITNDQKSFGVSQATRNVRFEGWPFNSTGPKVYPEANVFSFWVHTLPPPTR